MIRDIVDLHIIGEPHDWNRELFRLAVELIDLPNELCDRLGLQERMCAACRQVFRGVPVER